MLFADCDRDAGVMQHVAADAAENSASQSVTLTTDDNRRTFLSLCSLNDDLTDISALSDQHPYLLSQRNNNARSTLRDLLVHLYKLGLHSLNRPTV